MGGGGYEPRCCTAAGGAGQIDRVLASLPVLVATEDLNVWGLGTSRTALTAHVVINAAQLANALLSQDRLIRLARDHLAALGIRKSTLQLEESHRHDAS